uniref:Reverse transcriptase domain-containing protein n=1 Tax=Trichogramma kaykai TaxID=54128 RepID=A0ABD2WIM9_9HYME
MASIDNDIDFNYNNEFVIIYEPFSESLVCELCSAAERNHVMRGGIRCGVFTGESRKSQLTKHLKLKHKIAADKIRAGCKVCGYVSMGKYSLKDVRAHIKKEHEAGQAEPVRARGAASAARPNSRRDYNNNINNNNTNAGGSGEVVNSIISSQNDRATAAETVGTNHGAAPSESAPNRSRGEDGPEEDSPGPTIVRTRRAARQRLPSMSDTDDDSSNTSVHEQQQLHQLAPLNTSVSPDVQRHQHVATRTQTAAATTPDSGSVTPPQTTPLSSRVTNANTSHSPGSPRRTLRPRAAATQQPRLQTTSRARHATSVPAESQGSQRQQLLPRRTLRSSTQESTDGRRSTTSTATQRAAPTTSRQQRSTSPTALARRSGGTRSNANSSASASTSRKSGSSPPAVRTTRAERLRLEKRARESTTSTRATPPPSRSSTSGQKRRTQDNAPQRRSSSQQQQAGPSRIRSPATTYAEATRGQTLSRASVSGEDIVISRASPTVTATGSTAATTSIAATLTTTTTTVSVCSGSIASAVSSPIISMACQRPEEVQVQLPSQTPVLSAVEQTPPISGVTSTPAVAEAATTPASPSPTTPSDEATAEEDWRVVGRSRRRSSAPTPPGAEQERRTTAASEITSSPVRTYNLFEQLNNVIADIFRDTPRRSVDIPRAINVPGSRLSAEETGRGDRHRPDLASDVSEVRVVRREQEPPRGNGARGSGRRGGRAVAGRGPTAEQTALIDLACLANDAQQLEQTATLAAEYLSRFTERRARGPAGGGRRNRRANGARGRQRSGDDPAAGAGDGAGPVTREGWVAAATRIQRLYRKNRRRAVQEVVNGAPQHCEISVAEVQKHFEDVHSVREPGGALPPLFNAEPPTAASNAALVKPFERAEVSLKLKGMNNSSPGPDGVTYCDLKRADPGCHVLAALFNACLRTGLVPQCWKSSSTILLHKKGDRADIGNWRPIAMGDTTAKLFASLIADRLTTWAVVNQRISPSQKGFLPYEGCFEHNFVLGEILRDAKTRRKEVVVAWLDLSNAFGSVPHASIHEALDRHSVPLPIRNLVKSSYEGVSTSVKTAGAITEPVRILSGVRQGCPLSPIVFNLALEPVVRAVQATGRGYTLSGQTYNNLFYADDGALVSDSPDGMRLLLRSAEDAAAAVGLRFNPSKSATLHLKGAAKARVRDTRFSIQGSEMRSMREGEAYEHLGVPTGFQVRQTPDSSIDGLVEDLRKLDQSLLAPWQKLEVAATFILPRLDFCLQGSHVEKGPLKEADKVVKKLAKGWMHLPQRASAEVVFLPPNMGGGGILPLADMADLYAIAHAFKLLSSKDAAVARLAWSSLECVAAKRLGRIAVEQDLADYLSGVVDGDFARPSTGTASLWSHARNAARRSSAILGLRWVWCAERRELGVECRGPSGNTITVTPQARSQVVRRLRSALVAHYRERLLAKKDQGKVYEVTSRSRVGNHFLRNGSFTRFAEWRFIHRARLDVLPLNATKRWQTSGDKRCRKCGARLETLPHVIQHCRSNFVAITKRHDGVLDRLVKALKIPGTVSVNRTVDGVDLEWAQLRPDLVVRDEVRKKIVIVDVAVPFENRGVALEEVRSEKLAKYRGLAACLERQGYDVKLMPFLVGALGGWDAGNERVIRLLGINRRYAVMMRRLMISDTIRWSRNVYVEHVSGARQY